MVDKDESGFITDQEVRRIARWRVGPILVDRDLQTDRNERGAVAGGRGSVDGDGGHGQ